MIRIAVFEDHASFLDVISLLLADSREFLLTGSYNHAKDLVNKIKKSKPDVVVMDIQMPDINGIEAVKMIKQHFPDIQVIMLTMFEDDTSILSAIAAGANGYLVKGAEPDIMLQAFRQVYEGGSPMSPGIARRVLSLFQQNIGFIPEDYKLTPREREILKALVDGMSYKMIADYHDISYHTVNAHIRKIYEKLQVNSSHEAVAKALKDRIV